MIKHKKVIPPDKLLRQAYKSYKEDMIISKKPILSYKDWFDKILSVNIKNIYEIKL